MARRNTYMECWNCGRSLRSGAPICQFCGAKQPDDENGEDAPLQAEAPGRSNRATGRAEDGRGREPEERWAQDGYRPDAPELPQHRPHDPDATTPRGERWPPRLPSRPMDRGPGGR